MPDFVQRPTFFEGQILGGGDLNLSVQYARDADARHLRLQHTWGIVSGLALSGEKRTLENGNAFVEVNLDAGLFIDGTGRATVVTESTRVAEDEFRDAGVVLNDPAAWYPVFVQAGDAAEQAAQGPMGGCQAEAPTRINETYALQFGRITDVEDLDTQRTLEVGDGPGGATTTPWRVLVGFVQWNDTIAKFTAVSERAEGVGRRYAGVRAGDVVGLGGAITVRSGEPGTSGARVLRLATGEKGSLEFGTDDAGGTLKPAMTVDADGNLTVTGKIVGALAGGVQVESGVATDGMLLPLPVGITNEQVAEGSVVVQSFVTPNLRRPADLGAGTWFPFFHECHVADRRVVCRVRWVSSAGLATFEDRLGVCDYVVMAFPKKAGGASS